MEDGPQFGSTFQISMKITDTIKTSPGKFYKETFENSLQRNFLMLPYS